MTDLRNAIQKQAAKMGRTAMIDITLHLFAGGPEDATQGGLVYPGVYAIDATWTPTVAEALRVLHQGGTAIIPEKGWEPMAASILGLLGAPPEHVREILHRATLYQRFAGDPTAGFTR